MPDSRDALQKMFSEQNRYANFGDVLTRIHVHGVRCHTNTVIDILSPITAFCGLNGSGKSTLLQLAATAYKNPSSTTLRTYYLNDFMVLSPLDPRPFTPDARIEFGFWTAERTLKPLTISRNDENHKWQGYQRRPHRSVFFGSIGSYLPKIEQHDFTIRDSKSLIISDSSEVNERTKMWTSKMLEYNYEKILSNTVTHSHHTAKIISVERAGIVYSEAHMGFGEGRGQYLIDTLESLPDKSLILLEEPETSLHASAQHEFGCYLVDVAKVKRHQIILTTHSEFILESLPAESRIYLNRTSAGISPIPRLTALQAKSLMAQGHVKALCILVEDACAQFILSEIIRKIDSDFFASVGIFPVGDANTVATTTKAMQETGLPVAAVRDADKGQSARENLFKLPGTLPPEKEMFASSAVKEYLLKTYNLNLDDFSTSLADVDHHQWLGRLANRLNQNEIALTTEISRVYVQNLPENETSNLVLLLKEASRR